MGQKNKISRRNYSQMVFLTGEKMEVNELTSPGFFSVTSKFLTKWSTIIALSIKSSIP